MMLNIVVLYKSLAYVTMKTLQNTICHRMKHNNLKMFRYIFIRYLSTSPSLPQYRSVSFIIAYNEHTLAGASRLLLVTNGVKN